MEKRKILIFGMTSIVGGVETYLTTLLSNINHEQFDIDLLVKGDFSGINYEQNKGNYKNLYVIRKLSKHPIKGLKFLKKIAIENQYDVVHFNIGNACSSICGIIFKLFSPHTQIFIHSHNGDDPYKLRHYLTRPIMNKIASKKLACSQIAGEWMYGKKVMKKENVILLHNFINTDKFLYNEKIRNQIRKKLNIQNDFVIGHVGRFSEQKNHRYLIDIFYHTLSKHPNIKLMLLGTGELESEIQNYVKELGIEDKVLFLGLQENANEYYQAMDLFVLPSLFEGLPVVGIEAQTSGLKCLFADTIDNKSDITKNVTFIPLNDIDLWTKNIEKVMNSHYQRENMKKLIIKANYDLKTEIKKIEKLYLGD